MKKKRTAAVSSTVRREVGTSCLDCTRHQPRPSDTSCKRQFGYPENDEPCPEFSSNDVKCQHCGSTPAVRRRQNTQYEDAESNFATLCDKCQKDTDEYWKERWDEYYAGQGIY